MSNVSTFAAVPHITNSIEVTVKVMADRCTGAVSTCVSTAHLVTSRTYRHLFIENAISVRSSRVHQVTAKFECSEKQGSSAVNLSRGGVSAEPGHVAS